MVSSSEGRRRRHSAAERRAVLERLASSGERVSAFCRSESINVGTLRRWQAAGSSVREDHKPRLSAPSGFLDLGALGGAITIEVDLGGGVVLRVRRG
ncbi:MAG: transposase [Pseudomonadota bacterium]